jgi:Restriction endonuclease
MSLISEGVGVLSRPFLPSIFRFSGSGFVTALETLLDTLRQSSMTEREKGTYFEDLILAYLRNEATYKDLYRQVWTWAEWAPTHGFSAKDDGIDLVAEEVGTGAIHAIQCKFYDPEEGHRQLLHRLGPQALRPPRHRQQHRSLERQRRERADRPTAACQQDHPA